MYKLINRWYEMTGQPCLINTSFNRHEEPIINRPEEAYSVLQEGIISAVVIGDSHLVVRSKNATNEWVKEKNTNAA